MWGAWHLPVASLIPLHHLRVHPCVRRELQEIRVLLHRNHGCVVLLESLSAAQLSCLSLAELRIMQRCSM